MKVVKWVLLLSVALLLIGICGSLLLKPDFRRVDFAGLGGHLTQALMKPITRNLDGSPTNVIDPKSAEIYARAGEVGMVAVRQVGPPPKTSQDLAEVAPGKRLDPWGHPFCLMDLRSSIAVISEKASANDPGCAQVQKEITAAPKLQTGILYRSRKDAWVLLVPRTNSPD